MMWIILSTYAAGWYVAAPRVARELSKYGRPRCHGENGVGGGYKWDSATHCRRYCRDGCWRPDLRPGPIVAVSGMALALVWPALLLVADVMRRSQGKPSRHDLTKNIARLERELSMGDGQ